MVYTYFGIPPIEQSSRELQDRRNALDVQIGSKGYSDGNKYQK